VNSTDGKVTGLAGLVAAAAPHLPPQLLGEQALARILRTAGMFPSATSDLIGLECRLGYPRSAVDFMFSARNHLAALTTVEQGGSTPPWRGVTRTLRSLASALTATIPPVRDVWLEFDLVDDAAGLPYPSIFIELSTAEVDPVDVSVFVQHLVTTLRDAPIAPQVRRCLGICLNALPANTSSVMIGVLLSRPVGFVRVCAQGFSSEDVHTYLARVGWSGPWAQLHGALDGLAREVDCLTLDLDVAHSVGPRVGVEYMFRHRAARNYRAPWSGLLTRLQQLGLCDADTRTALLRFCTAQSSGMSLRLNHVKVVHAPDTATEAKAYLFIQRGKK
jgi:hypothetical protein